MATHTEERACSVCKKNLKNEQQLTEHMKIHTGVKCTICGKVFKDDHSLTKHMKYRHT